MRGIRQQARALGATMVAAALVAPAAVAAPVPLTPDQQAEYEFQAGIIGPAHALEHVLAEDAGAEPRQAQPPENPVPSGGGQQQLKPFDPCLPRGPASTYDFSRALPPKDKPTGQARCGHLPRQPRTAAKLAQVGRWSKDILDLPHYAIHAALLPSGKVMFYGYEWTQHLITRNPDSHQNTSSDATLWDPRKGYKASSMRSVLPPLVDVDGDGIPEHVPLYCSGLSFLPDGKLLVTGGTLDLRWAQHGFTEPPGLKITLLFDPRSETWTREQDMTVARWYPTQAELADGRTIVLGGFDDQKPTNLTGTLDVISRDGTKVHHAPSGDRVTWTYPGLLLMPDAKVLLEGPRREDTGLLDPKTLTWSKIAPLPDTRGGENLVPVPTRTGTSPEGMVIGGADFLAQGRGVDVPAYRTTYAFDSRRPSAGWIRTPSQQRPRNWPNTVLLPDGSMVTVGGGTKIGVRDISYASSPANRHVELWDPRTKRWRLGPAQREDRAYHSVALLLPDGRVWSAGDDANPNRDGDTAEIYEPPYLFRGPRPRIAKAPARIAVKRRFALTVRAKDAPARVTMLAPSAVTHARDMHQRFVELKVLRRQHTGRGTWRVTVAGPRSRAAAPPGPWMLFALSERGAASTARWTSLR